jgi:hypothetical protein
MMPDQILQCLFAKRQSTDRATKPKAYFKGKSLMGNICTQRFKSLMATNNVLDFMVDEGPIFKNEPAMVVADAIRYCKFYRINFGKIVESARKLEKNQPYTGPAPVLADLMTWCKTRLYNWDEVVKKAELFASLDTFDDDF